MVHWDVMNSGIQWYAPTLSPSSRGTGMDSGMKAWDAGMGGGTVWDVPMMVGCRHGGGTVWDVSLPSHGTLRWGGQAWWVVQFGMFPFLPMVVGFRHGGL